MGIVFVVTLMMLGVCAIGLGFNLIFRKDKGFPDSEIGHSLEMKKRGIRCAKEDELRIWGKKDKAGVPVCDEISCGTCVENCK